MVDFTCIVQHPDYGWLILKRPRRILTTMRLAEVADHIRQAESAALSGAYVAGFVAYEAAPAFDPALAAADAPAPEDLPLFQAGIFDAAECLPAMPPPRDTCRIGSWCPSVDARTYREAMQGVRRLIAAGDTYQVNYTFRMEASFEGDAYALFCRMTGHQAATCQAWIHTGRFSICSASPELFFQRQGLRLTVRPMKGTIPRAPDYDRDRVLARRLATSPKDRAENVMIVDMLRNDLGRVARPGSVQAVRLFEVEAYPTLYQMTSTVTAQSAASLLDIFRALFPCASITGAPKVRTTQIIRDLEKRPRGIYTGAVGVILPGGDCRFNVAIRTALVDHVGQRAEYGVGSGIVWDSQPESEYEECLLKTRILTRDARVFDLLETLLWRSGDGWFLADRHLDRMARSAAYFGFDFKRDALWQTLLDLERKFTATEARDPLAAAERRVRITLSAKGEIVARQVVLPLSLPVAPASVAWALRPIDIEDPFLYHKTTWRRPYEQALDGVGQVDDVLLWNPRGEATESSIANLVALHHGRLVTPPVRCGLLAGTVRGELLARGILRERVLDREAIAAADALWLVNSVRGWRRIRLVATPGS